MLRLIKASNIENVNTECELFAMTYSMYLIKKKDWISYLYPIFEQYILFKYPDLNFTFDHFDVFLRVYITSCVNQYWLYDEYFNLIGFGVYKAPSNLANHSCDPNIMHFFDGIKLVKRAIKPIKAGDPVEITYIDGTWMPFNF